jgi:hypothetical protein
MSEPLVDTAGAIGIYAEVTGRKPSIHTFRRWSIPYRRPHGIREYRPSDVRQYAERRIAEAPVIVPAQTPRRRKVADSECRGAAREAPHQESGPTPTPIGGEGAQAPPHRAGSPRARRVKD